MTRRMPSDPGGCVLPNRKPAGRGGLVALSSPRETPGQRSSRGTIRVGTWSRPRTEARQRGYPARRTERSDGPRGPDGSMVPAERENPDASRPREERWQAHRTGRCPRGGATRRAARTFDATHRADGRVWADIAFHGTRCSCRATACSNRSLVSSGGGLWRFGRATEALWLAADRRSAAPHRTATNREGRWKRGSCSPSSSL
jgi:hypothetical protein